MSERIAKSKIYDNVFTDLFSDPANQLKVYQSLHPEDHTATVADISDVTKRIEKLTARPSAQLYRLLTNALDPEYFRITL